MMDWLRKGGQKLKWWCTDSVYAGPRRDRRLETLLTKINRNSSGEWQGLNLGAGNERLGKQVISFDLVKQSHIDVQGNALRIPFRDDCFDVVVARELLEHVSDPFRVCREMARILKPGGTLYCSVPFMLGYHPRPTDYWRFTREGLEHMLDESGFEEVSVGIADASGTAYYRLTVDLVSNVFGRLIPPLHRPLKGMFALLFYPIRLFNYVLQEGELADRIPGGYYAIAHLEAASE